MRALIEEGRARAVGAPETLLAPAQSVRSGQRFEIHLQDSAPSMPAPESVPLEILHEDDELLVVNKPPGMLVHPTPGIVQGTLVNALLAHGGGGLSAVGGPLRPGIVHRIDRGTGGLLVVAKTDGAHAALAEQFAAHDVEREYYAVCWGAPRAAEPRIANATGVSFEPEGWIRIEAAIGARPGARGPRVVDLRGGKRAVTRVRVEAEAGHGPSATAALLRCRLETGRTHQIRVHLVYLGSPLVGDREYGRVRNPSHRALDPAARAALGAFSRPALHAARLGFRHPVSGRGLRFEAPPPVDFRELVDALGLSLPQ